MEKLEYKESSFCRFFLAILVILFLWTLWITFHFYITNKPLLSIIPRAVKIIFTPGEYSPYLRNINFSEIGLAIFGCLLYTSVGFSFLTMLNLAFKNDQFKFDRRLLLKRLSLGFVFGLGIITIILELFSIFNLLYFKTVLISFASVIAFSSFLSKIFLACKQASLEKPVSKNLEKPTGKEITENRHPLYSVINWIALALIFLISFFTFYHACLYPETYWDSLIYYIHYGKMTYQQHGFPKLITAQVGLKLGANYPHLFPLIGATLSTLFNHYSDLYLQFVSPTAGLIATIIIYLLINQLFKNKTIALLGALLFRSIPYSIVYFIYASDYSMVILFTTALLYTGFKFLEEKNYLYLLQTGLIASFSVHINYLMWLLFVPFLILLVWWIIKSKKIKSSLLLLLISIVCAIPWYIRNWIVTGNPVYPFFYKVFNGININPEVLASCFHEWQANGIGVPGETILLRLTYAPYFFYYSWHLAPILLGFSLSGILIYLIQFVCRRCPQKRIKSYYQAPFFFDFTNTFTLLIAFIIFALGFFYHLVISNLYLYHIVFIIPTLAIFAGYFLAQLKNGFAKSIYRLALLIGLLIGFIPGLAMSLMGFKLPVPNLLAFRYPGMDKMQFLKLALGDSAYMWEYINQNLPKTKLLTHENRYHYIRDDIEIIHLDDLPIQKLYSTTDLEKKAYGLAQVGIQYYLFIPNERNHPVTRKLEIPKLIEAGYFKEIYCVGEQRLFKFIFPLPFTTSK